MAEVLLNQEQIKEIIPHRDPFLLIDEVLSMEVGKKVVARKYIKEDDFWFKGHFPEKPVTPGVLMIEMLAQATKDAKQRAESMVKSTGSHIGVMNSAKMGVFQIVAKDSTDVSDYGIYNTTARDKKINAVVNATFTIK